MRRFLMVMVFGMTIGVLAGCEQEGPMERAGEQVDQAAEETGEAVEDVGES
jgi:predicted small lipoprotein YifL